MLKQYSVHSEFTREVEIMDNFIIFKYQPNFVSKKDLLLVVPQLVTPIIIEHSKMLAPLEPASAENCTCQLSNYHVRIT